MNLLSFLTGASQAEVSKNYTQLNPKAIHSTIDQLEKRIGERFPESGLRGVCQEFRQLAVLAEGACRHLRSPIWPVRISSIVAGSLLLGLALWALVQLGKNLTLANSDMTDLVQTSEAAINELIFLGLALFSLLSLETRLKRQSALRALHQLRSLAHVVDMHQLTKDPASLLKRTRETPSSPERTLNRPQLTRYLDYCAELLALVAKVAALFGQNTQDTVVLQAVNDIEQLTQGLSVKIWQKIMILDLAEEG